MASAILNALGVEAGEKVFFQSRFKNYELTLKKFKDEHGEPQRLDAKFFNYMLVIDATEANKEIIELLRKGAGSDYQEIDLSKKVADEKATNSEIAKLRRQIKELEKQVAQSSDTKVKKS